jgi:hypothetical protein
MTIIHAVNTQGPPSGLSPPASGKPLSKHVVPRRVLHEGRARVEPERPHRLVLVEGDGAGGDPEVGRDLLHRLAPGEQAHDLAGPRGDPTGGPLPRGVSPRRPGRGLNGLPEFEGRRGSGHPTRDVERKQLGPCVVALGIQDDERDTRGRPRQSPGRAGEQQAQPGHATSGRRRRVSARSDSASATAPTTRKSPSSRRRRPSRTRVSSSASSTRAGKARRSRYFFRPARTRTSPTAAAAPAASGGMVTVSLSVLWT